MKKIKKLFLILTGFAVFFAGLAGQASAAEVNAIASTTMLTDLVKVIAGDTINVVGLMGPGVDPHLYEASAGDVKKLQKADLVLVHGLHLEGRFGKVMEGLTKMNKNIIVLEDGIDPSVLMKDEENVADDPHVWFDVSIWKQCAEHVAKKLSEYYPDHAQTYADNLTAYLKELDDLDAYIRAAVEKIPEQSRVLVTAHDAFRYFGRAYGIEVKGLQGISTEAEAGTADISALASFIAERKIKAIFVESSVSDKALKALQEAVRALGFEVGIGGELYSDSTGDASNGHDTYIAMLKHNIDTIAGALQ